MNAIIAFNRSCAPIAFSFRLAKWKNADSAFLLFAVRISAAFRASGGWSSHRSRIPFDKLLRKASKEILNAHSHPASRLLNQEVICYLP